MSTLLTSYKKMRRNIKYKYIKLQGEIAYSKDYVFFVFPNHALEPASALSLLIKCKQRSIPCSLELGKSVEIDKLPKEVYGVC